MMKRLLIYLMLLAFALPNAIAGEKTVTISRNEGIYDDGTGVYYCTKGGITMTFSSGLNNVNYLVEHQQVVFDIFSTNYVIKKIKFNCLGGPQPSMSSPALLTLPQALIPIVAISAPG